MNCKNMIKGSCCGRFIRFWKLPPAGTVAKTNNNNMKLLNPLVLGLGPGAVSVSSCSCVDGGGSRLGVLVFFDESL